MKEEIKMSFDRLRNSEITELQDDIEKGNCVVSTLPSEDISMLYNMRVLKLPAGEPETIIQDCFNQIKSESESGNIGKGVCIILKLGFQSSVSIQILNALREVSEYLESKNVVANFAVIKTEKLDDSEIQLITLIS